MPSDGAEGRHDVELGRWLHAQRIKQAAAPVPGAGGGCWWVCRCGRKIYDHGQRTIPSTGGREHVCGLTASGRFEPATGHDYGEAGLRAKAAA